MLITSDESIPRNAYKQRDNMITPGLSFRQVTETMRGIDRR
jgi:hypothetical protein